MQQVPECESGDPESCETWGWHFVSDANVSPTPPFVTQARVFYYYDGDPGNGGSVDMAYDDTLELWIAQVPIAPGMQAGHNITYYITAAPAPPVFSIVGDPVTCTMSWTDPRDDAIAYNGWICEGSDCTAASTWTPVFAGLDESGDLQYIDMPPQADQPYTYCVTAVDAAQNQSAIFPSGAQPNCGVCVTGSSAQPPAGVTAVPQGSSGVALWWQRSLSDISQPAAGYQVYRCSLQDCSDKTPVPGAACADLPADGQVIADLGQDNPLSLSSQPAGTYYYGVIFRTDCSRQTTESIVYVSQSVTLQDIACTGSCIHVSNCRSYADLENNCSPVSRIDTSQNGADDTFLRTPVAGLEVVLADSQGQVVGESTVTNTDGVFPLLIDNNSGAVDIGKVYKVLLKVPAYQKAGIPCDSSMGDIQGNCYVILSRSTVLSNDDSVTARVYGVGLPPVGGGRAEVGNRNCDNVVDIGDLAMLKPAFGAVSGDEDYKTYLDFDGNGVIDIADFSLMKSYFGMELDQAPSYDAALCSP